MICRLVNPMMRGRVILLLMVSLALVACGKAEISDAQHVIQAKQYQSKGDLKATLIELKNALQKNANNSEARLMLGELYVLIGNGAAAEKELNKALQLGVSSNYVQQLRGKSLLLQGRHADVLAMLSEMDVSSQPDLLVLRGEAQLGLGQNDLAAADFSEALVSKADDPAALLGQARMYIAAGEQEKTGQKLEKLLATDPENVEAWVLRGDIANRAQRQEEAQAAYQRAIDLAAANIVTRAGMAAHTGLTKLLITQQKFEAAASHVEYLLKASPNNPMPNYMAGLLAYEKKDYTRARDYFQTVLKFSPDYIPSVFLLGSANYALGNMEQAEQQLTRVVGANPSLLAARMLLANLQLQRSQTDLALDVLEPALAQRPNDLRLLAMAGQAALQSGEFEKGRAYLQKAIASQPEAGALRAQLAVLHLAEGNDALAIDELEQAVKLGNAPAREQSLLALAYLKNNDFDKAIAAAEELAAQQPKSAYAQNLLGVILSARGEVEQARTAFATALKREPDFTPATLNLARLDVLAGRSDEARARLDGILAKDANNTSAMMALAQLADAGNDRKQALEWLERTRAADAKALSPRLLLARYYSRTGNLARAGEIAREAVTIDINNPQALELMGSVELAAQNYSAAVNSFKTVVKQQPTAQAYYSLGVAQFRANNLVAAKTSLRQSLEQRPGDLQALSLLALLDVKTDDMTAALRSVAVIKKQHPQSPAGFVLEGDIRAQQKQGARAAGAYARARELGAGTPVLLKEAAALQSSQGSAASIKLLSDWVASHKDDVTAHYALAAAYSTDGKRGEAMNEYRRLLQGAPKFVPALNDLAWLLHQNKQLDEALLLANKAYEQRPDSGPVLDTLGWIRLQQGEIKPALELLRQAAEKMPESGDVQYHLAAALAQSGKKSESRRILEQILKTGDTFQTRQEAQQLLEQL